MTKGYPRLLSCHPMEVDSMRRTMFVLGYLRAKGAIYDGSKINQKKFMRLHKEAHRAFDEDTSAWKQLHQEMVKRSAAQATKANKELP